MYLTASHTLFPSASADLQGSEHSGGLCIRHGYFFNAFSFVCSFFIGCQVSLRAGAWVTSFLGPRLVSLNRRMPQRARIPAEFRARIFKPVLGSSGALREVTPQDYRFGGRLASSAGVL